MKAIFHIGAPKAGSSSIQQFLKLNAEELAKRGVRYERHVPQRGSQYEYPLAAMVKAGRVLDGADSQVRYKAANLEEMRQNYGYVIDDLKRLSTRHPEPTAVFSSEHVLPWIRSNDLISTFHEMFAKTFEDVRYVVYLRRQDDLILSGYSEQVKRGHAIPFAKYLNNRLKGVNLFRPLNNWLEVVGAERLDVRLLQPDALVGGNLIDDFCQAIGVDSAGLEHPPRENEALSAVGIEVMRALNTRIPELLLTGELNPLRHGLLQRVKSMTEHDPKLRMTAAQRKILQREVAFSNRRLCKTFFPDRETLLTQRAEDDVPPMTKGALLTRVGEVMTELVLQLRLEHITALSENDRRRSITTDNRKDVENVSPKLAKVAE